MTRIDTYFAFALALGVSAGLTGPAASADARTTLTYRCAGGKTIVAVIGNATTTISVEGDAALQNLAMHDVASASGVKTSNGKLIWWTKGDEGFLAEEDPPAGSGDVLIADCREVPAAK